MPRAIGLRHAGGGSTRQRTPDVEIDFTNQFRLGSESGDGARLSRELACRGGRLQPALHRVRGQHFAPTSTSALRVTWLIAAVHLAGPVAGSPARPRRQEHLSRVWRLRGGRGCPSRRHPLGSAGRDETRHGLRERRERAWPSETQRKQARVRLPLRLGELRASQPRAFATGCLRVRSESGDGATQAAGTSGLQKLPTGSAPILAKSCLRFRGTRRRGPIGLSADTRR
jgi:hypothetical protein